MELHILPKTKVFDYSSQEEQNQTKSHARLS